MRDSGSVRGKLGSYGKVLLEAILVLYAVNGFQTAFHELSHGAAALLLGGEIQGIELKFPLFLEGHTYPLFPFVETPYVFREVVTRLAGPLFDFLLMMGAISLWHLYRRSRSWLWVSMTCAAASGDLAVLAPAIVESETAIYRYDLGAVLGYFLGFPQNWIRFFFSPVAAVLVLLVGIWFCRALLWWAQGKLPSTTVRERFLVLLVAGWLPVVLLGSIEVGLAAVRGDFPKTASAIAFFLGAGTAVGFPVMWWVARRGLPGSGQIGTEVVASGGAVLRLARAAFASAAALGVAYGVTSYWDPDWKPTAEEIRSWVERAPRDPKVLRRAAFWSHRIGQEAEAIRYRERAVEVAPEDAGALFDLGMSYRFSGKIEEARRLFERARQLRPDFGAPYVHLAKILEESGDWQGAARMWREALAVVEAAMPAGDSRDREVALFRQYLARCEELAAGARPGDLSAASPSQKH